jgi:hypothetical protein
MRRSLFRWPYLLRRRHGQDRENFFRAWDYALQSGRVKDLANLARAVADFSIARGIPAAPLIAAAVQALIRRRAAAPNDPVMLHLHLVRLDASDGITDQKQLQAEL